MFFGNSLGIVLTDTTHNKYKSFPTCLGRNAGQKKEKEKRKNEKKKVKMDVVKENRKMFGRTVLDDKNRA